MCLLLHTPNAPRPAPSRHAAPPLQEIAQKGEVAAQRAKECSAHRKEFIGERAAAARDARALRNRGVLRVHERLARERSRAKEDDRAMRLEALKASAGCVAHACMHWGGAFIQLGGAGFGGLAPRSSQSPDHCSSASSSCAPFNAGARL